MKRKVISILVMLLITGTIFIIPPTDLIKEASAIGGYSALNLNYIKDKTEELSDIIKEVEDSGLDKGRAFGTEGERHAAGDIANWMTLLDLDDPTSTPGKPYHERIDNIDNDGYNDLIFLSEDYDLKKLTHKVEVKSISLTVHNNSETPPIDHNFD